MSDSFDAYHKWLGIPPADQPADAYRLLGVPKYESDLEVIACAADRQMAHVKAQASGPYSKLSQKILNQLSKARTCLLNAEQKLQYDKHLRQQEGPALRRAKALTTEWPTPAEPTARHASTAPTSAAADASAGSNNTGTLRRSEAIPIRATKPKQLSLKVKILGHVVAPLVGLSLGYVVLCRLSPSQDIFHLFSHPSDEAVSEGGPSSPPQHVDRIEHDDQGAGDDEPPRVISRSKKPVAPVDLPHDAASRSEPAGRTPVVPDERPSGLEFPAVVRPPFAKLAAHVDLPSASNREPVSLGTIFVPSGEKLQLALRTAPLVGKPNYHFEMQYAGIPAEAQAAESWLISLVSETALNRPGAEDVPIARFFFQDQSLNFQWSSRAESGPATQLRNCLLEARVGEATHAFALRGPQQLPPLVLQMKETVSRIVFQIPDCPLKERIYLSVRPESRLGPVQNLDGATALINFGERIEFRYEPATLSVRLADRRGELAVEVSGEYKIGGRDYPFSTERLKKHVFSTQKQLEDCLAEGRRREADAYRLNRQISSLARRSFPNSPSGIVAQQVRDKELASLRAKAARNSKKITWLKKQVPELQATLQEMPAIVALTNTLRAGCKIHYRVALLLDSHEIDLAVSSDDVQEAAAIESPSAISTEPSHRVKTAMETLEASPDDPAANLLVGSYYCLEANDWAKGAPLLARSGDDKLAAVVKMDRAAPADIDAQIALADAWFDLATADRAKRGFFARAGYWYRKAQAGASGLSRLKIEKHLETIDAASTDR